MRIITTRRKDVAVVETVTSISIFNEASIPHESDFIIGDVEDAAAAAAAAAETVAVLAGEATSFGDGAAFACAGGGTVCGGRRVVHDDGTAEAEGVEGTAGILFLSSASSSLIDPINKNQDTINFSALSTVSNFKINGVLRRLPRVVVDDILK